MEDIWPIIFVISESPLDCHYFHRTFSQHDYPHDRIVHRFHGTATRDHAVLRIPAQWLHSYFDLAVLHVIKGLIDHQAVLERSPSEPQRARDFFDSIERAIPIPLYQYDTETDELIIEGPTTHFRKN